MFQHIPGAAPDMYMINRDMGTTFSVGHYNASTEKLALISGPDGKAVKYILDSSEAMCSDGLCGVYKWVATGQTADGRLLSIAWVDEGECAGDSPRGYAANTCS